MLHKKDIKTGNIVPIYTEHQSMEGLTCMALLLEKDKSFDQSVFIKEERDPKTHLTVDHTRLTLRRGQIIYHKNAQTLKWGLYFLSQIGTMSMTLDSVDNSHTCRVPVATSSQYFRSAHSKWEGIIYNNKNYIVVSDTYNFCYVVTQAYYDDIAKRKASDIKQEHIIALRKPFSYTIETYERKTFVFVTERWKVRKLTNPFFGELKVGDVVYYKDAGRHIVKTIDNGRLVVAREDNESRVVVANTTDLFVDTRYGGDTYCKISYSGGTSSRVYNKKKQSAVKKKDDSTDDIWEMPDPDF